jgi:uncharacterized membrane protein YphA (DoxX/SURF4 family)
MNIPTLKVSPLVILRYSYVVLFLWFGTSQLLNPGAWTSFLPEWLGYLPMPPEMFVQLNGWAEIIAALFLLTGTYVRLVAGFLALHLFGIAISTLGAIGMRDAILAMIGVTLAAHAPDECTLDAKK